MLTNMRSPLPACLLGLLLSLGLAADSVAQSPIVGFTAFNVEPGVKVLLANPFHAKPVALGQIAQINGANVSLSFTQPPSEPIQDYSVSLVVHSGNMAGLALEVAGVNGSDLTLERSVNGLVSPGQEVQLIPHRRLANLFGSAPNYGGFGPGATVEEADVVSILDPKTQAIRAFYPKLDQGWREVGKEEEGDKSSVGIPFHAGFYYLRRASFGPTTLWFAGRVSMYDDRYIAIWPGRNWASLLTLGSGLSPSDVLSYQPNDPFSVTAALSAAEADSAAFARAPESGNAQNLDERWYYRLGTGWRVVGREDLPAWGQAAPSVLDFHSLGPPRMLRLHFFGGTVFGNAFSSTRAVPCDLRAEGDQWSVSWDSRPGARFRVKTRALNGAWQDHGAPVLAATRTTEVTIPMSVDFRYAQVIEVPQP